MRWQFWKPVVKVIQVDRPMDEIELAGKLAGLVGDIDSIDITKDGVKEIYNQLAGVDGLLDHLRDTMKTDIQRYFAAGSEHDRDLIRGAFLRTAYMRSLLLDNINKT